MFPLYQKECPELSPVLLHSGLRADVKEAARARLLGGHSKVIVCVDMLGEGFDFPSLKIAAVHDAHKSLPVTLQFVGRFTRAGSVPLGDATVVANIADESVRSEISRLYSQDADWDQLIEGSYESSVG
ncbi:MAG: restriction endonuclease subunit R, partial [Xanthomonadales bacterium]|nr:restriction endonuclease subunit R [Xanthomonadales bacterium]